MPQHKSAKKRMRQSEERRQRNQSKRSRMRTLIKKILDTDDKEQATSQVDDVKALIDRLSNKGLLHRNKAARYKSKLDKHVNSL